MGGAAQLIGGDTWAMIAILLKPRDLLKLLLANKKINKCVDTDAYWARVALHLLMREDPFVAIRPNYPLHTDKTDAKTKRKNVALLPPAPPGMFSLVNMNDTMPDYRTAMDAFIQRARQALAVASPPVLRDDDEAPSLRGEFPSYAKAPLVDIIRMYEKYTVKRIVMHPKFDSMVFYSDLFKHCDQYERLSMKQVAEREHQNMRKLGGRSKLHKRTYTKMFRAIQADVTIRAADKRRFANALSKMVSVSCYFYAMENFAGELLARIRSTKKVGKTHDYGRKGKYMGLMAMDTMIRTMDDAFDIPEEHKRRMINWLCDALEILMDEEESSDELYAQAIAFFY